ncbi:glycosyltransferase [Patescibacteria group bacterium]|nr:glycosyltransferase [Patescibacteria group bacterium]
MKISVIIPTYNSAHLLPRAVKSVLAQTHQDFEVIIVDDGSTDKTGEVARVFADYDRRIQYYRLESNFGGAARPKNLGLEKATGEFIAVLDADDEWRPEKLERQLKLFEDPEVGFVGCNAILVDEQGVESKHRIPDYPDVANEILETDYMGSGSSTMYRRKVLSEGFDENLKSAQDWEMRIRLGQKYKFALADGEPLIKYHQHAGNISKLDIEQKTKDLDYIKQKYLHLYRQRPKVYSNKLRYDGTRYMIAGERMKAWRSFGKSIRFNPSNLKTYLYFVLSLLGSRVYLSLAERKRNVQSRRI